MSCSQLFWVRFGSKHSLVLSSAKKEHNSTGITKYAHISQHARSQCYAQQWRKNKCMIFSTLFFKIPKIPVAYVLFFSFCFFTKLPQTPYVPTLFFLATNGRWQNGVYTRQPGMIPPISHTTRATAVRFFHISRKLEQKDTLYVNCCQRRLVMLRASRLSRRFRPASARAETVLRRSTCSLRIPHSRDLHRRRG